MADEYGFEKVSKIAYEVIKAGAIVGTFVVATAALKYGLTALFGLL